LRSRFKRARFACHYCLTATISSFAALEHARGSNKKKAGQLSDSPELITPIPLDEGLRFTIREGGIRVWVFALLPIEAGMAQGVLAHDARGS